MDTFYTTVSRLHDEGRLLGALPEEKEGDAIYKGRQYWKKLTELFPEIDALRTYRLPLVNMDMIGELQDECIQHKMRDPKWLVKNHYYRALNSAPELCDALSKTGYSFVVDSTMSNPEKITAAAEAVAKNGYELNYAIFHSSDAVERVMDRGKKIGREITYTDAVRSQQKMPANFDLFVQSAQKLGGFLGLYDTTTSNDGYRVTAYTGKIPYLKCLNPGQQITHDCPTGRLVAKDWRSLEQFKEQATRTVG